MVILLNHTVDGSEIPNNLTKGPSLFAVDGMKYYPIIEGVNKPL